MIKNITCLDIFQEEVNSEIVLENVLHREDEWIFGLEQYIFFSLSINDLTLLNQNVLINSLHSQFSACLEVNYEEHFAEGTLIDNFLDLKILQLDFIFRSVKSNIRHFLFLFNLPLTC